jgi:hypothetical protein
MVVIRVLILINETLFWHEVPIAAPTCTQPVCAPTAVTSLHDILPAFEDEALPIEAGSLRTDNGVVRSGHGTILRLQELKHWESQVKSRAHGGRHMRGERRED